MNNLLLKNQIIFTSFILKFYKKNAKCSVLLAFGLENNKGLWFRYRTFVEVRGYDCDILYKKDVFSAYILSAFKSLGYLKVCKSKRLGVGISFEGLTERATPLSDLAAITKAKEILGVDQNEKSPDDEHNIICAFILQFYKRDPNGSVLLSFGVKNDKGLWSKYRTFVETRSYDRRILGRHKLFSASILSGCKALGFSEVCKNKNFGIVTISGLSELKTPLMDSEAMVKAKEILNVDQNEKASNIKT